MSLSSEDIAALLQREGSGLSPDAYDEASQPPGSRQRRTEMLGEVLLTCQKAVDSGSEQLDLITQKLGDGSRDAAWRLPYGDSGILEFFAKILAVDGPSQTLKIHALRIVGNSCADTDENRARVVDDNHLATIILHLQDERLLQYTIPVLFNTLVDYEPAQLLASRSLLNIQLTHLLASPNLTNYARLIPYICKILALLVSQEGEASVANPSTAQILLTLATSPPASEDVDDFVSLVSVAAAYLANETFQESLVSGPQLNSFMEAFYHAHTHFDAQIAEDPESAAQLKQLNTPLLTTLADLTGNDSFASHHPLESPVPQSLLAWLKAANPQLQAAACLALGNLSRSDEISIALVQIHLAHVPLMNLLSNSSASDPQQLHSALSFLKNLAIPSQNKPILGALLEPSRLPRMLALDTLPQVQFAAVSLTRLLLVNCAPNAHRLCAILPPDLSERHTSVLDILTLFGRSDAEPTKLEAARCIAALCRVLHSTHDVLLGWVPSHEDYVSDGRVPSEELSASEISESVTRGLFYKSHDVTETLSFLITQQKWPILRSEAWFVFALMSRSKDGASVVLKILSVQGALDALTQAIAGEAGSQGSTEQSNLLESASPLPGTNASDIPEGLQLEPQQVDPKQQANMARVDRENCLVLCTEVVKNRNADIAPTLLASLQDLIRKGTEMVFANRTKSQ
ncbi:hypothetical protein G7046_g8354 [Stylonectria norvegica]|nr:hypothetical protein G7046_g8354 [Stylonectria norvegica]